MILDGLELRQGEMFLKGHTLEPEVPAPSLPDNGQPRILTK